MFKNILLYTNCGLAKLHSVHMYVIPWMFYFGVNCMFTSLGFYSWRDDLKIEFMHLLLKLFFWDEIKRLHKNCWISAYSNHINQSIRINFCINVYIYWQLTRPFCRLCFTFSAFNLKVFIHFRSTVDNKKNIPPVFQPFVFPVYLRNQLSYKKICLYLFAPFSNELSVGTRVFQIWWKHQLIFAKTLICQ